MSEATNSLEMFFSPRSIAVIGASREKEKVGGAIFDNIIRYGYQGKVFPVNPKADKIGERKCYSRMSDVPGQVDMAIVVIPSRFVPQVMEDCGKKGVKGVMVISAGFKERGGEGARLEKEILEIATRYGMRLWGPNCLGLIDTSSSLNASFAEGMPPRGKVAFMSQSGALCTAILDWARGEGMGFSKFVSMGNKADLSEVDFLQAWQRDAESKVILGYIENVQDGSSFLQVGEKVSREKPVIFIKSGGTQAGAKAASSHTGSLAGSEEAYKAAFRQCGIFRAGSLQDLFDLGMGFSFQPLPSGRRVAILTNAGGPGIMAADACEKAGLTVTSLTKETVDALRGCLPPEASFYNPVDILGDADDERYRKALEAVVKDSQVDGVIVILTPQAMTDIEKTARAISGVEKGDKPLLASFMGEVSVRGGIDILREGKIPNYPSPERAASVFLAMAKYGEWRKRPKLIKKSYPVDGDKVKEIFREARSLERVYLCGMEAGEVVSAYGLSVPDGGLARSSEEAVRIASRVGYPVVMKIASPDIVHKSDVGGVKVGLSGEEDVVDSYDLMMMRVGRFMPQAEVRGVLIQQMVTRGKEVILGVKRTPEFGPLLMFGLGGIYVEMLKDVSWRLAPLDEREAREMIEEIRSYPLLAGIRGEKPTDVEVIVEALLRISQLVSDFPGIIELDINPLKVDEVGKGATAVDVRMVLTEREGKR